MKSRLLVSFMLFTACFAHAQNISFWSQVSLSEAAKGTNVFSKTYQPSAYVSFHLNERAMRAALSAVPSEKNVSANKSSFIITVPNSKGQLERFRLVEASVMQEGLQAKHPDIRSYAGRGIDEPGSVIRCDMTPDGFHGMILSGTRNTIYINPVDKKTGTYIVFDRNHLSNKKEIFDCKAEAIANAAKQLTGNAEKNANDGQLRVYRFAVESGGEFSALLYTSGTDAQKKAQVLSALTTDLTRIDGILEADFGVRLDYINNEDNIIYLDGSTDPYTSSSSGINGSWNTQSQSTLTSVIGTANYDIGHLLMGYPTGGNAGCIGCVCTSASKGKGATGFTDDLTSDPFVVDFWIHEIGHQFGANHTFNYSNEGTGVQMEPGSGITIMGYAGTTGTYDDSSHSIPYFHGISIQQVTNYIQTGNGNTCGTANPTGDALPTASAGADYTIPASTPFTLTGSATDADASDVLTYDWEQFDNGTTNKKPVATATSGPQFRCYNATVSTQRNFPDLKYILTGANTYTWEVLPSVSRTMNFRLTVRDNHPGGGQNNSDDMVVTVSGNAGPFKVTAPNTSVTYVGGSTQNVTWNVASTTASPVSCANVAVLLSTDGGNTFPYTLAASTPNNGSAAVMIPNVATAAARIKIAAVGNIFFDIDDANFTITSSASCSTPAGLTSGSVTTNSATVSWSAVSGANSYDVDYKPNASSTWVNAATATTSLSVNLSGLASATLYDWRVRTNCASSSSAYATAQFTTGATSSCNSQYDGSTHNTFSSAVAIPLNTNIHGTISTASDADYYSFNISTRGTATVNLTNLPADYDLYIYKSSQQAAGKSKNSGTANESISKTFAAGTFYIKVISKSGAFDAGTCYTLNVTTGTATLNSAPVTARIIPQTIITVSVFPNPVHSVLTISNAKMTAGSIIKISDVYGKNVIQKQASSSAQQVDVSRLTAGIYMISVINKDGNISTSKFVKE